VGTQRMCHQVHVHNFRHLSSGLGLNDRRLEWGTVDRRGKEKEGKQRKPLCHVGVLFL